jgi:uncharacterized RDD family membrane protein YckC/Zn-dependent protease with chaperone function
MKNTFHIPKSLLVRMLLLIPGYFCVLLTVCLTPTAFLLLLVLILLKTGSTKTSGNVVITLFFWGCGALVLLRAFASALRNTISQQSSYMQKHNDLVLCNPTENHQLYEFVNKLADLVNSPRPKHIILAPWPSLYVSNRQLRLTNATVSGLAVIIGLPYIRLLNSGELRSLLAHELSHFSGYDLLYTRLVRPFIYGLYNASLITQSFAASWKTPQSKWEFLLLPFFSLWNRAVSVVRLPNFLLNRYLNSWLETTHRFMRYRETRADLIATQFCGRANYSRALVKAIGVQNVFLKYVHNITSNAIRSKSYPANIYKNFLIWYYSNKGIFTSVIQAKLQNTSANNTHPPLFDRLQVIKEAYPRRTIDESLKDGCRPDDLLVNLSKIEEMLTDQIMIGEILRAANNGYGTPGEHEQTLIDKQAETMWTYNPPLSHVERRLYSFITDTLIILVTSYLFLVSAYIILIFIGKASTTSPVITYFIGFILFPSLYYLYFETSSLHSTPGKYLFHLSIGRDDRRPITLADSILRMTFKSIYCLFFVITVPINIIIAIRSFDLRMLYDILANTDVLETKAGSLYEYKSKYRFIKASHVKHSSESAMVPVSILNSLPHSLKPEQLSSKTVRAVLLAEIEARRLGKKLVGTEHILLGLIAEGTGLAAKVLNSRGIKLKDTRARISSIFGIGSESMSTSVSLTPKAVQALEYSLHRANRAGHNTIETDYLLLALINQNGNAATTALKDLGVDPEFIKSLLTDN